MKNSAVQNSGTWKKAVVIGGAYAGLVTARVLADHFSEVVILERDLVDERTGTHPSAPQEYHAHALLAKGGEILERFFPGLRAELQEIGAPVFDYGEHLSFLLPAGFAPRNRTGVEIQAFTRDELERRLRGKVLALPEVTFIPSARCEGLRMTSSGKVNRVLYRTEGVEQPTEIEADLVVNASGRSSALDNWLTELGLSVPEKRVVKAKITYTSMSFDRSKNGHLVGQIETRTDQGPTHRCTNTNNQWRLYHKMKDWPDRLIAIGDAVCVFNPVYGQGLTVAALEAELLHRTLTERATRRKGLDGLARNYQRAVARILLTPWTLSSNSDLMWNPDHQPLSARFAHWYNRHFFEVSVRDAGVWTRFARVANMVAPPTVLFHPSVVAKVFAQACSTAPGPPTDNSRRPRPTWPGTPGGTSALPRR